MFKFRDSLQLYQLAHESDNLFAMLQDYRLDNRLSRTLMNNQMLIRMGTLYPLYNDSEMMKFAIDNWFDEYDSIIKNLLDLKTNYDQLNPFENVDWTDDYDGTRNDINVDVNGRQRGESVNTDRDIDLQKDVTDTRNITEGTDHTLNETKDQTVDETLQDINTVSAYDSNDYQPQNKLDETRINQSSSERDVTEDIDKTVNDVDVIDDTEHTDDTTSQQTNETETINDRFTGDRTEEHTLRHKGKEGIQNYTEMLNDARNAAQFDIYDWILDRLERAVCLGVY